MLRIIQNSSAAGAKNYFSASDYYSEGQELEGTWHGKGAERLGLRGAVTKQAWDALCENTHPFTGEQLTSRRKAERRVGYDISFHVPKSVSILYAMTGDQRILDAFRTSVNETMQEMEQSVQTRVRQKGRNEDRTTGELIWAEYVHLTSRPVDGIPDPHLHCHCFAANATFDQVENRWKAAQFGDLKRDAGYFEAKFHSRLAWRMTELGLGVDRTAKGGWEIRGVPVSAVRSFSRRTALIEKTAKAQGITDPVEKAELGQKTRERKQKSLSMPQLRKEWESRLTAQERSAIDDVAAQIGGHPTEKSPLAADKAAAHAIAHVFERKSVVPEKTLLAAAIRHGAGQATAESVEKAVRASDVITGDIRGRRHASTRPVLAEEQYLIGFARDGRGACPPLNNRVHVIRRDWLNGDQRRVVEHVAASRDRVILISGRAGTGKTTTIAEAVEAIEDGGPKVFTFAPSASASEVLRREGFESETVARLLVDQDLQNRVKGQLIWVDETSLVGCRTMAQVFRLADRLDARVVLSGDRQQHGSVQRGDVLRLLEAESGVAPVQLQEILRQREAYKEAVKAFASGHTTRGLVQLDRLGWDHEVSEGEHDRQLSRDYADALESGHSALICAPTHVECGRATSAVRLELQARGMLETDEREFRVLHNQNLTAAQRGDPVHMAPGSVAVFHQNAPGGIQKGARLTVGKDHLPLKHAEHFMVFSPDALMLAKGDRIRFTRNGTTADGRHRLTNGAIHQIAGFKRGTGEIVLTNGWTVAKDFGFMQHGYAVTTHSAQGQTVEQVFVSVSSEALPALSQQGAYVAASRGRSMCHWYTDDKQALLDAAMQSEDRMSATDLLSQRGGRSLQEQFWQVDRQRQADADPTHRVREREALTHER